MEEVNNPCPIAHSVKMAGLIAAVETYELSVKFKRPDLMKDAQQIVKAVKTGNVKKIMKSVLEVGE